MRYLSLFFVAATPLKAPAQAEKWHFYHPQAGRGGGRGSVTLLARGARPPGCAQAAAADVVAGGVVGAAARLAAVLAVPVLLARFGGSEAGTRVNTGVNYGAKAPANGYLGEELETGLTKGGGGCFGPLVGLGFMVLHREITCVDDIQTWALWLPLTLPH